MPLKPTDSKFFPPKLPAVISRNRLHESLRSNRTQHLILIVGQAAQGKSTLMADYFSAETAPVAWLFMDSNDGDSANFFHLLICAISRALSSQNFDKYLHQAHIALSTSDARVRYEAQLRSLWQRLPADIHVVLDGLEQLPTEAAALELIQVMVALAEEKGRIILLSRQLPPFKIQQWMMRRQVLILGNDELAFTPEEISAYFKLVHDFELSADGAAHLFNLTEGWVGGIVLLSQTLSRMPETQWEQFFADQISKNPSGDVWRYFAEEVFDCLREEIQDFLVKSSPLEVIDPDLLSPIYKELDLKAILDDLAARHLFIQMVHDAQQRPLYRLHHMFQDFLKQQFKERLQPVHRNRIYEQVATLYRDRRQAELAITYYIKAGNLNAAMESIKKVGTDFIIRGRFSDLAAALSVLPEDRIQSDPWLLFLLTLTRRVKGGVRNIHDFQQAMEAFEKNNDTRGYLLSLAFLIEAQVFAGHHPGVCQTWIHRAEALLAEQKDRPYFSFARALLWLQIGFAYIASGLDLTKGISACQNAYLLAHKINDPRLMANANIVSVMGLSLRGEFTRADESLEKISAFIDTDAYTEYHALRSLVNAQLALHRGNFAQVRKQLVPLADEIEKFGMLFLYPAYVDTKGLMQIYRGEFEATKDTCRHLLDVATLSGNTYYEGLSYRLSAMRHYFQGNYYDALAAANNAIALLQGDMQPTLHWMRMRQLSGLIWIHLGKYGTAEDCLQQALRYFQETANVLSLTETYLCLALLCHVQNDADRAAKYLAEGFAKASERQFDHYVMMRPSDLDECCRLAIQLLDKQDCAWAEHLLLSKSEPKFSAGLAASSGTHLSDQNIMEANHGLQPSKAGQYELEIRTLGGFKVLRQGQGAITKKQWGGNRAKLLLKAILVHGTQDIPKDMLLEDLWPESPERSANQNFKVTLHRLRKILEPDLEKHGRSSFVHLKNGLVSLEKERCWVDMQHFLTCCKDIKRADLARETGAILSLGRQVMDLYQGDFLPEDPYAPWVEMKRLALKDEFIATLMMMADIYQSQDRLEEAARCCRTAIAADACLEQASDKLMQLYLRQGRQNDAAMVYQKLYAALKEDLGVEPDPAITEQYRKIRS